MKYSANLVYFALRDLQEKYEVLEPDQNLTETRILRDLQKRLAVRKEAHDRGEKWATGTGR